jgi:hypothetical protein
MAKGSPFQYLCPFPVQPFRVFSAQMAYSLAKVGGLWEYLGQNERLSLLLSALCHDVEHPGVSGAYLHKARAPLATWFQGDPGLLEKHHSVRTYNLLAHNHNGLLSHLPSTDRFEVRCLIRDAILATDMSQHMVILADLEANLPQGPDSAKTARDAEPRQRLRWLQVRNSCARWFLPLEKF